MLFRQRQQMVILSLAIAMIGGSILFWYLPLHKKLKAIEHKTDAHKLTVTKAAVQRKQIPVLERQLAQLKKTVENYQRQVPGRRDIGGFLQHIANLMSRHGLTEQLVEPGREIKEGQLSCIPINLRCKGDLEQLFGFFNSLQDSGRLVRVEQVKLVNKSDFSGWVSMQANAAIYYRDER